MASTEKQREKWRAQAKRRRDRARAAKAGHPTPPRATRPAGDEPGMMHAQPVRIGVVEETTAPTVAAPMHDSAAGVPEAGSSGAPEGATGADQPGPAGVAKPETSKVEAPLTLDPKICGQITKGIFAIASLRLGEHWKVTDEEIDPITEPMARQLQRIPIIAALGQNAADLIVLGSTLGTLIFLRAQESKRLHDALIEQRRGARVYEMPRERMNPEPRPGETREVYRSGDVYQEVREPDEPKPNLEMFR